MGQVDAYTYSGLCYRKETLSLQNLNLLKWTINKQDDRLNDFPLLWDSLSSEATGHTNFLK